MKTVKTDDNSNTVLSNDELNLCRSPKGNLNSLATQPQSGLSYEICDETSLKDKKVRSISVVNKLARKAKKISSRLLISALCRY